MINVTAPNRVYKEIKSVMNDRLDKVYQQNQHVDGPWSVACEEELKKITGRKYAFMTTSGTTALFIAMMLVDVKPKDNVFSINYSIPSTVMPAQILGANLKFNDINKYGQQDLNKIQFTKQRTKAIITTGLYGDTHDNDLIANQGIPIINDSCQCFLSKYKGVEATSIGDISILSFAQNKVVPTFGTYGAILTDNDDWADKIKFMRKSGYINNNDPELKHLGINGQPHEDKCVQVFTALENKDKWQSIRKEIKNTFDLAFKDIGLSVRPSPDYSETNAHKYCIFVDNKQEFNERLREFGVNGNLNYIYNFAKMEIFNQTQDDNYPYTDFYVKHAMTLPAHPWLTKQEIDQIIESVKKSMQKQDYNVWPTTKT